MSSSQSKKYKKIFRTILITGIAFGVNYGINLVLTPFITNTVGTEAYGYVTMAKNFAQYASIITIALNSYATRYISIEYHRGNFTEANKYFSSVLLGDCCIGLGILLVAFVVILNLDRILIISPEIVRDVKQLFVLVFLNFTINTICTVFGAAALIKNKLDLTGAIKAGSYVVEAITLICCYKFFRPHVFYVGISLVFASLVIGLSNIYITRKETKELRFSKRNYSWEAIKKLVINGIWNSINSIGNLLNSGLDLLICNLMLTGLEMGQLAIAKTMETMFAGLLQLVATAFQPVLLKDYADKSINRLKSDLFLSMKVGGFLSDIAFALVFSFGMEYFALWIPGEDIRKIYELTVITVFANIAAGPMVPMYYIYTLTIKQKIPCYVTIIGGILNVISMYLLIRFFDMGVYAVAWTTAVIMSIINFVTNPLYMAHVLKLPRFTFFPSIIRNVISCIVMTLVCKMIASLYTPKGWAELIIVLLGATVIGLCCHIIVVLTKQDYIKIKKIILKHQHEK